MRKILDALKRGIDSFRQSFSARLSLWVVLSAALIFFSALLHISNLARKAVWTEAMQRGSQVLDNCELRLVRILEDVEQTADNIEWLVYRHLDSPDTLFEYTRNALQGNPDLIGCGISFEPYFMDGKEYFSAYSSRTGDVIETVQEGDDDYHVGLPRADLLHRLGVVDALGLYDVAKPHVGGVFREGARRQDLAAARRAVWLGYDPDDFELLFAQ